MQPWWKTVWRFVKNLKIELPYDPEIPLLGIYLKNTKQNGQNLDSPDGPVVKNPPTNAEDTGLIPGPGRFPHAVGQLSSCISTTEPKHPKVCALQQDKPWQ